MSNLNPLENYMRTTPILNITNETKTVKIFTVEDELCAQAKPGQFLMLWIPGKDEIPISILEVAQDGLISLMVKKVGEATEVLHKKKIGDVIGIRGPFGNSFDIQGNNILLVSGGTGVAPLYFLSKNTPLTVKRIVFIMGAQTKDDHPLISKVQDMCSKKQGKVILTTEDGSVGIKGIVIEPLEELLRKGNIDQIYTCGPEKMVQNVFDLAEKYQVNLEASLERLMRCAIGLCGSCVIGAYRVCKDGPIFTFEQLKELNQEFGISKRDLNGEKIPID